jgi:hypothetical protein
MFKKFVVLVLCASSLYGMEEKDNGLSFNRNSRSERMLEEYHPYLTMDMRNKINKYIERETGGKIASIDYEHIFATYPSKKDTFGFHVTGTRAAQRSLNQETRVDHKSGAYWADLKTLPAEKRWEAPTHFPDSWDYKKIIDSFIDVCTGRATQRKVKPNGDLVLSGQYENNKTKFYVVLIVRGSKMISAYPSLGKDAYENALRYKKFLSKK